ncbi:amino acid ABC transporter permease [Pseudoduganella sp. UC29_106]|uniref:amino acid ABC transporter permease n=1 Tax=Pseudoduganella sp. UC29_106 TaxID=3374553 RepID=UPI003757AE55
MSPMRLFTVALCALLAWCAFGLFHWAVGDAVFAPDAAACAALDHRAACWGVVAHGYRAILFGGTPPEQRWHAALAAGLLLTLLTLSSLPSCWRRWLGAVWSIGLAAIAALTTAGQTDVQSWGGLPLTLFLTVIGCAGGLLLGTLLALGRTGRSPALRRACTLYIECLRGVPMITVLFMASYLVPLLLPGAGLSPLARVLAALALFEAAYFAEVLRGGLQAIPAGQYEAAAVLGFGYWQTCGRIVLPQVMRTMLPAIVNNLIGALKSTSLVVAVGLQDLTGALQFALADPAWRPFALEAYLFVGAVYFALCFPLSRYSRFLESRFRPSSSGRSFNV